MKALHRLLLVTLWLVSSTAVANEVRLKDLGRFNGWRDNMLVGYGLVTGLSGSGDSPRNRVTRQTLANVLSQFDLVFSEGDLQSRNVAAVMVTAVLPPSASMGDKLNINVTSIGDARSLAGGVLLMTPLRGPDRQLYALGQGPITIGGYRFDYNGNLAQKNSPTSGLVIAGGYIEQPVSSSVIAADGSLTFLLKDSDVTTAQRVAERITGALGGGGWAVARDASAVYIKPPQERLAHPNALIAALESLTIAPDRIARVVINERTGTVVAGANVQISAVAISHGDIRVTVQTEFTASQPTAPVFVRGGGAEGIRSLVVANSRLDVAEGTQTVTAAFPNTTVADLVQGLAKMRVSTRDMIAILQAIKASGAMYAELVVQ